MTAGALYTPEQVVTNDELVERLRLGVDPTWIEECTGLQSRCWLPEDLTTSDLAVRAARRALEQAALDADEIDRIVVATVTPEPCLAETIARELGARCMAVDLTAGTPGFLHALDVGIASIRSRTARRVLVIGVDAPSRSFAPADPRSAVCFGDGAAAVVLEPSDRPGFASLVCGRAERRPSPLDVQQSRRCAVEAFVASTLEGCGRALASAGCSVDHVDHFVTSPATDAVYATSRADWVVTHQGNARLVELLADALRIPRAKAWTDTARYGNASCSALPMRLIEAWQQGHVGPGDIALVSSVGAGAAYGATVYVF